jgi:uncharacterized membrane protein YeaQ/YmgE (transglycosylase-associated protein family)
VGLIARAVLPGADHIGLALTIAVGITGSWLSGSLGSHVSKPAEGSAPPGTVPSGGALQQALDALKPKPAPA